MDAVCTRTRDIRKMEIMKFLADFEVNRSEVGKSDKTYLTFSQQANKIVLQSCY